MITSARELERSSRTEVERARSMEGSALSSSYRVPQQNMQRQNSAMVAGRGPLTLFLGLFSLGLGLAQVIWPGTIARLVGIKDKHDNQKLIRLIGARELAAAGGIFGLKKPAVPLWSRVAGDVMDLTLLGKAASDCHNNQQRVMGAFAAVAAIAGLDLVEGIRQARGDASGAGQGTIEMVKAITINRSPEEVYAFWRDFRNLPRFMGHLESVHVYEGGRRSHWVTKAPLKKSVEWDAEITQDRPNEMIAWQSLPGADVDNGGAVFFKPASGGRGTEVKIEMRYTPPAGMIGKTVAQLFGEAPERQVYDALRELKQVMETGEVLYSDSSVHGHPYPAQPSAGNPKTKFD